MFVLRAPSPYKSGQEVEAVTPAHSVLLSLLIFGSRLSLHTLDDRGYRGRVFLGFDHGYGVSRLNLTFPQDLEIETRELGFEEPAEHLGIPKLDAKLEARKSWLRDGEFSRTYQQPVPDPDLVFQ